MTPDYIDPETSAAIERIKDRKEESTELVVPGLGTVVDLTNPHDCALALADVRMVESAFAGTKKKLTEALVDAAKQRGTKTLHLDGEITATVRGGERIVYDAEEIELGLRKAGMPEDRIREIVKETVSYQVVAVEAKRAAGANPDYALVIDGNKSTIVADPHVTISRQRVDASAIVTP